MDSREFGLAVVESSAFPLIDKTPLSHYFLRNMWLNSILLYKDWGEGKPRVAKAGLIAAVPKRMLKTTANPVGLPKAAFDKIRLGLALLKA